MTDEQQNIDAEQDVDLETVIEDETEVEQGDDTEADETGRKGNAEAARWRVKFRDAEATNAVLSARVEALQTAEAHRLAEGPGRLVDGTDVLRGATLADLLDDDGNIDPEAVSEAVQALVESKPHLQSPKFAGDAGQGSRGTSTASVSWADVIRT